MRSRIEQKPFILSGLRGQAQAIRANHKNAYGVSKEAAELEALVTKWENNEVKFKEVNDKYVDFYNKYGGGNTTKGFAYLISETGDLKE